MSEQPVIYSVGDIHGYKQTFVELLKNIKQHHRDTYGNRPARLVTVGDYVDRGPDSKGVVEMLMYPERSEYLDWFENRVHLKGNHEAMMVEALRDHSGYNMQHWTNNGGNTTIDSYYNEANNEKSAFVLVPESHVEWMEILPIYYEFGPWLFVHAGVDWRNQHLMESLKTGDVVSINRHENSLLWIRDIFLDYDRELPWRVVHGHSPESATPTFKSNRINLDTSAYWYEFLTAVVLDPEDPVDEPQFIQVSSRFEGGKSYYRQTSNSLVHPVMIGIGA